MYEPPIEIYEMANDVAKQMREQKENYVYECIEKVGVNVNKEELIKALQYDREQYNKGYNDGVKDFAERLKECCYTHSDICGYQSTVIDVECVDILLRAMSGDAV